jgi:hypothetical protein
LYVDDKNFDFGLFLKKRRWEVEGSFFKEQKKSKKTIKTASPHQAKNSPGCTE